MARRRCLFRSYFYIEYNGTSYGKAVTVLPFGDTGGTDSFTVISTQPWYAVNVPEWISLSTQSGNKGSTPVTLTVSTPTEAGGSGRTGTMLFATNSGKFKIDVYVSQGSAAYIRIAPQSLTMGPTETYDKLYCYLEENGVTTDISSAVTWTSSLVALTVSNTGVLTANNNLEHGLSATVTATYTPSGGGSSLSAMSSVAISSGVVSYQNYRFVPVSLSLDSGDTVTGQTFVAYVDKYINTTLVATYEASGTTWSIDSNSDPGTITIVSCGATCYVYPVYNNYPNAGDGLPTTYYPTTRNADVNGSVSVTWGSLPSTSFTQTGHVTVAPQGLVEMYLTVSPTAATITATGTQQLVVTLHTVTDGVDSTTVVTSASTYSSNNTAITVNNSGLVTANNQGSGSEQATITVSYPGVSSVTALITAQAASIDYRNLTVVPATMYLDSGDTVTGKTVQAFVDEYVNNQFVRQIEVTSAATWSISPDTIDPTAIKLSAYNGTEIVYSQYLNNSDAGGDSYYPDNRYAGVVATYLSSAATCQVTVGPEGRVQYSLTVSPSTATVEYGATTSLTATYITKTDGVVTSTRDVTSAATYNRENSAVTVSSNGVVTGNNTGTTSASCLITVIYAGRGAYSTITSVPKPDEVDYRIDLFLNEKANETVAWNGTIYITAELYKEVNGVKVETISALTTEDGLIWGIHPNTGYGTLDDATWDPTTQILAGHNLSNRTSSWNCTASYTFRSGGTTVYAVSHNHNANFTSASSIVYDVIVSAGSASVTYSGSTPVSATYVTIVEGVVYNPASVDITTDAGTVWSVNPNGYGSVSNGTFQADNTTNEDKAVTVSAVYQSKTGSTTIEVLAYPDDIAYNNIRLGLDTATTATTISLTSSDSANGYELYWDKYNHGTFVEVQDITSDGSYSLYSGSTLLGSFNCSATGTKYSDSFMTINYTVAGGIAFSAHNGDPEYKSYNLVNVMSGLSANTNIVISVANVEYRNLVVLPVTMTLDSANTNTGEAIQAFVDEYVNGQFNATIEVTSAVTWSSNDTSVAVVATSGNGEVVRSVYGSGYFPTNRSATITATYLASAATCDVTVGPEGRVEHDLWLYPRSLSLGYQETSGLQAIYYTYVDGVQAGSLDVTSAATYSASSSAVTVTSAGVVTGNNTGTNSARTSIRADYLDVMDSIGVTATPAERTYTLEVEAAADRITPTGTTQMSATAYCWIDGSVFDYTALTPDQVSWTIETGASYASVSNTYPDYGLVTGTNSTTSNQTVVVRGEYDNMVDDFEITVQMAGVDYRNIHYIQGATSNTISSVSLSSGESVSTIYVYEDMYVNNVFDSHIDSTEDATFVLYSGNTQVTAFTCSNTGLKYSGADIAIYYQGSANGIVIEADNDKAETKYYTLSATSHNNSTSLDITIAPAEITYTLEVTAADSAITSNGSTQMSATYYAWVKGGQIGYTALTPNQVTWEITNGSTYANVSNGGIVTGTNMNTTNQTVTVMGTYNGVSGDTNITVLAPAITHQDIFFVSATTGNTINVVSLSYNESKNKIFAYEEEYLNGDFVGYYNDTEEAAYTLYSGGTMLTAFTCNATGQKYSGSNITIAYTGTTNGIVISTNNLEDSAKVYTLRVADDGSSYDLTINIAAAPLTYTLEVVATPSTIAYSGTSQMSATYKSWIGSTPIGSSAISAGDVTWNITDGSNYASIANSGLLTASNLTASNQAVTVSGTYNGVSDDAIVTIQAAPLTYTLEVVATPSTIGPTGTSQMSATYKSWINSTLIGSTAVSANNVTWAITDGSSYASVSNAGQVTANNTTESNQTVTVKGTYNGTTGDTNITVQMALITYQDISFYSGNTGNDDINSVSLSASDIVNKVFVFEDKYVNGNKDSQINITSVASYTLYSGATALATFACDTTGEKYNGSGIAISYNGTTNGIVITANNIERVVKNFTLVASGNSSASTSLDIEIAAYVPAVTYELVVYPEAISETLAYSGSQQFSARLYTVEDDARTSAYTDVTSASTWSISTQGGSFVVSSINNSGLCEWVNLASTTGQVTATAAYSNYSDSTEFNVSGVSITTAITLTPATTSVTYSNTVDYEAVITISHDGNQVYSTTIDGTNFDSNNMSISSNEATYGLVNGYPMRFENTNNTASDKIATVTFTWEEGTPTYLPVNTVLTAQATAEVVKQVIISYQFEITPKQPGIQLYSDSLQFTAKLWTCENGVRVSSVDVTSNVSTTWSCTDVYDNLSVLNMDNDVKGLVHFVNLTTGASNTGRVTVSASYGNYSDSVTFDVEGLNSLTYSVSLSPDGAIVNYGENQDYYAEVIIYHNGITVYRGEYFMESDEYRSGDTGEGLFSSEDDTIFEQNGDYPARFQNKNSDTYQVVMGVTFAWTGPENLVPAGTIIEDSVTAVLNPYDAPPTYSVTFSAVNPASIDTLSYSLNMGTTQNNSNVSTLTISNLDSGDIIAWSAVTTGYVTKTGTTVVTGNNIIPINMTPNQFSFSIAPKDSSDSNVNDFWVSVSTTNAYSTSFVMRCSGTGYTQVMTLPANYITDDNDVFTFVVTRGDGYARIYDWRSTGSLGFIDVGPNSLNNMLRNLGFSYATNINLKYNGKYIYSSDIIFKIENAPVGFEMDCSIYRSTTSAHSPGTNTGVTVPNEYIVLGGGFLCPFDCNALDTTQYYRYVAYTYTGDAAVSSGWITPTLTVHKYGETGPIVYSGPVDGCNIQLTDRDMEGSWWILTSNN